MLTSDTLLSGPPETMVAFNYSTMQMTAKVVYYGPGLGGKTTNLQYIYDHTSSGSRGEMVLLETEADRTLFFDLLPLEVGSIAGFRTRLQLYTVPGQVFYNTTRKLVLKGVDGVVFVADSQRPMLKANVESFRNLEENLAELDLAVDAIPLVLQYNKRDLPDPCPVEEMDEQLNRGRWPRFEASAVTGEGVFETLKAISKLTLVSLRRRLGEESQQRARRSAALPGERAVAASTRLSERVTPGRPEGAPPADPAGGRRGGSGGEADVPTPAPPAGNGGRRPRRQRGLDVLAELERIRRQALHGEPQPEELALGEPAAGRRARSGEPVESANGRREISRDIRLTMSREELDRARRFSLRLQVQDDDDRVTDIIPDLQMDLESGEEAEQVVLRLNIALNPED